MDTGLVRWSDSALASQGLCQALFSLPVNGIRSGGYSKNYARGFLGHPCKLSPATNFKRVSVPQCSFHGLLGEMDPGVEDS